MKRITPLFLVLFTFIFYSCDQESNFDVTESSEFEAEFYKETPVTFSSIEKESEVDYCQEPVECTLWAGQHIDAGTVSINNDENNLYVKVYSKAGFQDADENIKMWIGTEAPTRRPPAGRFPYKVTVNGDTHIFKIPLSTLPGWERDCVPQDLVIIVHADVLTESDGGQTAFGGCEGVQGKPWWAYMTYTTECCEDPDIKLGWLYKTTQSDSFVKCFKDNNNFGFSNEVHYGWLTDAYPFYPIWMNVEDDCGIDNVVQVGNIWLSVVNLDSKPNIKLEIKMIDSYMIDEFNVYVGWTNPIVNKELNQSLESVPVNDNSYNYYKEVSKMLGTLPPGANPGFYIIAQTKLQ